MNNIDKNYRQEKLESIAVRLKAIYMDPDNFNVSTMKDVVDAYKSMLMKRQPKSEKRVVAIIERRLNDVLSLALDTNVLRSTDVETIFGLGIRTTKRGVVGYGRIENTLLVKQKADFNALVRVFTSGDKITMRLNYDLFEEIIMGAEGRIIHLMFDSICLLNSTVQQPYYKAVYKNGDTLEYKGTDILRLVNQAVKRNGNNLRILDGWNFKTPHYAPEHITSVLKNAVEQNPKLLNQALRIADSCFYRLNIYDLKNLASKIQNRREREQDYGFQARR